MSVREHTISPYSSSAGAGDIRHRWVSDPSIDRFDKTGKMTTAIRPPEALIPKRNGSDSFSSDSPPIYVNNGTGDDVSPADNPTGRDNNHGKPPPWLPTPLIKTFMRLSGPD